MKASFAIFLVASPVAALAFAAGCQATSMCTAPGPAMSGQIVRTENSAAYQKLVAAQNGAESAHTACRAEATITVIMTASEDPSRTDPSQDKGGYSTRTDPHFHPSSQTEVTQRGTYRVLGLGRGTDRDDCGRAATQACNEAVEEYFRRKRTARPMDADCQLNSNQDVCAVGAR